MPKDKSSGKKLADMMYGNPEGAAFGITPMIGKRREDRQDREAAKSFPVDLARGVLAGAVGIPGDIESLARLPYELYTGNESPTILPTSEDVLKRIPFGTNTPAGQFASGLGTLAGGSANLGAIPRAVKAAPGALKTAARNLSTPDTLNPQAGVVRVGSKKPVIFSDNPDVMQLELEKKTQTPMKASEALGRIEGRPLIITQADRTKVGGGYLGGPGFSGLQLEDPAYRAAEAAWAVKNPGTAKMILGGSKAAGKDPVYAAMLGTPTQHQSNQMVFDKLLGDFKKAAKKGDLDPELRDRINMRLANTVDKEGNAIFPPDVDILDKKFKDLANTFDRRSVTANLIGGMGVGGKKGQIIDYDKIIRETTDPMLLESPTGALGNRLFTLSGGVIERPDLHPAFPTIMQGEDLGVSFDPVARELIMKDFMEKTMREKGRTPGYMDYTRGYPPSQLITEDLLTELQKMGKKAGGAVRKAAGGEITADDLILEERKL